MIAPIVCFLTVLVVWMRQRFRRNSWQKTLLNHRSTNATASSLQAELALLKVRPSAKRDINNIVQMLCSRGFILVALIEDTCCDIEKQPCPSYPSSYTVLLSVSPLLLNKLSIQDQSDNLSVSVQNNRSRLLSKAMSILQRCNHHHNHNHSTTETTTTTTTTKIFEECVLLHDSPALLRTLDIMLDGSHGVDGSHSISPDVMQPWSSLSSAPLVSH